MDLGIVGHFLNHVGNNLLSYIQQSSQKKIFMPKTKALSIKLLDQASLLVRVEKTEFSLREVKDGDKTTLELQTGNTSQFSFKAKAVVICNGAVQKEHPDFTKWFPDSLHKLVLSDDFLKKEAFSLQCKRLAEQPAKKKIITIIGGSHSGFSCAWMLLNGPASQQPPEVPLKRAKNCSDCCNCPQA